MCPGLFAIASSGFTHTDMVKQIYKQFGIYNEYVVGVQAGPLFKAWFTGMEYVSLSQTLTPILSVSHMTLTAVERRRLLLLNWTEFQRRLLIARRKEKTVFASIDTDILVPYKHHLHAHVRTSILVLLHVVSHSLSVSAIWPWRCSHVVTGMLAFDSMGHFHMQRAVMMQTAVMEKSSITNALYRLMSRYFSFSCSSRYTPCFSISLLTMFTVSAISFVRRQHILSFCTRALFLGFRSPQNVLHLISFVYIR